VTNVDGGKLDLRSINGKPILVVYESQEAAPQNAALKEDLSKLASGEAYRDTVALVPVADVEAYDFWPARGFVKDAIRDESKKLKTPIYVDWDGSFRKNAGLRRNMSTVILIGKDANVRFAHEGPLSKNQREELLQMLRNEVEPPRG
jgi:predicted transcriptional regulator